MPALSIQYADFQSVAFSADRPLNANLVRFQELGGHRKHTKVRKRTNSNRRVQFNDQVFKMKSALDESESAPSLNSSDNLRLSRRSSEVCAESDGLLNQEDVTHVKQSDSFWRRNAGFLSCNVALFVLYLVTMVALAASHSSLQKELQNISLYCGFSDRPR